MRAYKFKNEEQLISIAKNNPRIFGELYEIYYPRIFGYIFRITGDHALASDITAETFLKAWLKIGSFQWKGISISSWFFKIATNELNQYFRKKKYSPRILQDLSFLMRKSQISPLAIDPTLARVYNILAKPTMTRQWI